MKKVILNFLILTLFAFTSHAQLNVYRLPMDSNATVKGFTVRYALPTTALKMTVTVDKVREYKGYYSDYASSLLGLSNVINENKTYYKLQKVSVSPVEVPDFTHAYLIIPSSEQSKSGFFNDMVTEKGLVPDLNNVSCYQTKTQAMSDFFKNYADLTYTQTEDAFVETKIIDGVVTQVPSNRTKTVSKTNEQQAKEAADAIGKSRKDQYALAAGEQETPYSAETIQIMLKELKQWENNYLSLFTGLVLEDEMEYTFYVIPNPDSPTPAFALNLEKGFSSDVQSAKDEDLYTIQVSPVFPHSFETSAVPTDKGTGYCYRMAQPATVTLNHLQKCIHNFGTLELRQLGPIQALPKMQNNLDIKKIGFIF